MEDSDRSHSPHAPIFPFPRPVSRSLTTGLTLGLLLAGALFLWWTCREPETAPPPRQSIDGLSDSVSIGWTAEHTAVLRASNNTDALAALGYVHGMTRPWTVTLWNRTALGTLSAAFGKGLVPLDRHARQLGFAHHARQTYAQLPDADQRRLQAYVRGLNAALQSDRVRRRDSFIYLNLTPRRWEPWQPLAIERLLAWLGTDFPAPTETEASELTDFCVADRRLRRWLHLHGRSRSLAWAAQSNADTTRTALFARHVLGATAAPVIQEVEIRRPNAPPLLLASLPGAPLLPTGTTGRRAWTYLLDSSTRLDRINVDSTRLRIRHERIRPAGNNERLVEIRRYNRGLFLPSSSSDSAWVMQWSGLRSGSDLPQWMAVAGLGASSSPSGPDTSAFHLFEGTGLVVDSAGDWTVQGRPPVVERGEETILVGRSPWAEHQAEALRARRSRDSVSPAPWSVSDSSTWAGQLLPHLLPALAPLSNTGPTVDEALAYLRNWNAHYAPAGIGAVLFEQWMRTYRTATGQLPSPSNPAYFAGPRRRRTFRRAVAHLRERHGPDVRQWRWERVVSERRHFPVWSADSLVAADLQSLSTTRFAPLERPGRGHASTLAGGPSLVHRPPTGAAPTHWDGWMWSGRPNLTVRRLRFNPSAFFSRSLLSRKPPPPVSVAEAPRTETTQLVPAQPERK